MIKSRSDLKRYLQTERQLYFHEGRDLEWMITSDNHCKIYRYVKLLRYTEYHYNNRERLMHKLCYVWYRRRKNILGRKLGIEMWENTFSCGLRIEHCGNIVINGHSRIGENCILHGSNCVGNDGKSSATPRLGNNIRLGVGAKVIGDVELADDITVAAGAVVVKSCLIKGAVLAGVPAAVIKVNA